MLLIRLTPQEELGYRLAGDCPEGDEQNTIEIVLAASDMDAQSLQTLAPILAAAAQRARIIITQARSFQIVLCDPNQTEPRYELAPNDDPPSA